MKGEFLTRNRNFVGRYILHFVRLSFPTFLKFLPLSTKGSSKNDLTSSSVMKFGKRIQSFKVSLLWEYEFFIFENNKKQNMTKMFLKQSWAIAQWICGLKKWSFKIQKYVHLLKEKKRRGNYFSTNTDQIIFLDARRKRRKEERSLIRTQTRRLLIHPWLNDSRDSICPVYPLWFEFEFSSGCKGLPRDCDNFLARRCNPLSIRRKLISWRQSSQYRQLV